MYRGTFKQDELIRRTFGPRPLQFAALAAQLQDPLLKVLDNLSL
jgi:hypothetical protein